MRRLILGFIALAAWLSVVGSASATLVRADFNDINSGQIVGQGGGTGLFGNWSGAEELSAVAMDLTAPASTNFALTQSGTPQHVRGSAQTYIGQATIARRFDASLAGTVWFSFLMQPTDDVGDGDGSNTRAGLDLNPSVPGSGSPSGLRIITVGTNLRVLGAGGLDQTTGGVFTANQTSLVLGRLQIDAGVDPQSQEQTLDLLSLWIDPDVENLPALPDYEFNDWDVAGTAIGSVGVESYSGEGDNEPGLIDLISLADGPGAYNQVTGVPEPASLVLLIAVAGGLISTRRR